MIPKREREYVATAKGGRLVYLLLARGPMYPLDIAEELECTLKHAYKVIGKLSLSVPIYRLDDGRFGILVDLGG